MALEFMGRAPVGPIEKQTALTQLVEKAEALARKRVLGQVSEKLLEEVLEGGSFWEDADVVRQGQFREALRRRRS